MASLTSIIIPNRNYARFLPELFGSLAAQSPGLGAVEAVFADDASTDGSLAVARQLGEALPFSRFEAKAFPRLGHPALTRNAGLALASGETVLFLDPDDALEQDFLSACLDAIDRGADIAYTDYVEHGRCGVRRVCLPPFDPALLATQNILTMGALMRREVVETLGGFRDNTAYEDWDFWVRAACHGFRFARVPRPLYRYRLHGTNFSHDARRQDGLAKATIIRNSPEFFPPEVRRWAKGLLEGKAWAQPLGRGLIPGEAEVGKLRKAWAGLRKAAKGPSNP